MSFAPIRVECTAPLFQIRRSVIILDIPGGNTLDACTVHHGQNITPSLRSG